MAKSKKLIAVDCGKFNTKAKSDIGELIFGTRYSLGFTDPDMLGEKTYNVKYKGQEYTLGDNANHADKNEGKLSMVHILSTLTAIALLSDGAECIELMYGESFNKYSNAEHKRRIKEVFEGAHTIKVGDTEYNFEITLCHILPEGIGHILSDMRTYSGLQYTIDWGGTTVIFIKAINGRPDMQESKSFHLGMHNVVAIIQDQLIKKGIGRYDNEQIEEWIENGCKKIEIQKVINNVISEQLIRIDECLSGFGINLHEYLDVTFIGGTSQKFAPYIKQHYQCANIYSDCLRANVNGYYEYGRAKYGK